MNLSKLGRYETLIQPVIERAVAKRKEARFSTAGKMVKALAAIRKEAALFVPGLPVIPPAIAKPIDLGFEMSGLQGQLDWVDLESGSLQSMVLASRSIGR